MMSHARIATESAQSVTCMMKVQHIAQNRMPNESLNTIIIVLEHAWLLGEWVDSVVSMENLLLLEMSAETCAQLIMALNTQCSVMNGLTHL